MNKPEADLFRELQNLLNDGEEEAQQRSAIHLINRNSDSPIPAAGEVNQNSLGCAKKNPCWSITPRSTRASISSSRSTPSAMTTE